MESFPKEPSYREHLIREVYQDMKDNLEKTYWNTYIDDPRDGEICVMHEYLYELSYQLKDVLEHVVESKVPLHALNELAFFSKEEPYWVDNHLALEILRRFDLWV